jgi:GDP-4-dehydro-6-deoxy-D-mannose reductase
MGSGPILLTGATGFVGRHVRARAADRRLDLVASSGDLRDPANARREIERSRPSTVIHLAAPSRGSERPWDALFDELRMAESVLSAASDVAPGATILIPGSAAQYGFTPERPVRESETLAPVGGYGTIKCALELVATSATFAGEAKVVWARSFNIVGPGQGVDAPVAAWASQIAELERAGGGVLRTGTLDVIRDFLDVRDVADAFLDLACSDFVGVVNVGSGVGVNLHDVVRSLVTLASVPIVVEPDPALSRRLDPKHVVADVTKLHEVTGFSRRVGLQESLIAVLAERRAQPAPSGVL